MSAPKRENYESSDEYIDALEEQAQEDIMALDRRQLQDIGLRYFEEGLDEEDFEKVRSGIRYYDLALNVLGSKAKGAEVLAMSIAKVLNEEQQKKIDEALEEVQKFHEQKAQTMADRFAAMRDENDEN